MQHPRFKPDYNREARAKLARYGALQAAELRHEKPPPEPQPALFPETGV